MFDLIYVNGDSYSVVREEFPVYSDHLDDIGKYVINNAMKGCNNDRIFRKTLEDLISIEHTNTLVILGFSFLSRVEVWYQGNNDKILKNIEVINNKDFPINEKLVNKLQLSTSDWIGHNDINDPQWKSAVLYTDINKQIIDFLVQLESLIGWLENRNIDYLIFSAADNYDWKDCNWDFLKSMNVYKSLISNNRILGNFFNFSVKKFCADRNIKTDQTYHMFGDGHLEFSKFLKTHV